MVDVTAAVLREARGAGIKVGRPVSVVAVRRRRRQLYVLVGLVTAGVATSLAAIATSPQIGSPLTVSPGRGVGALTALIVAFCTYCLEKEVHLRRLEKLLAQEREYSAEVTGRLGELTSLLAAGRAVNSELHLRDVLDAVLGQALKLFSGARGSVSLVEGVDELVCVSAVGNDRALGARVRFGDGIAGRVAHTLQPVLVDGPASPERFPGVVPRGRPNDSAMSVPLIHRGRLLGVLNITAPSGMHFDDYDLRLLCLFAEHATSGIVHARMHDDDARRVEELVRLEQTKTDFITGVSHDLRTPLTSIVGCTTMARRSDVAPDDRDELLRIAETQARRLAAMVERLLISAELGVQAPHADVVPVDLGELVASAVAPHRGSLRVVVVDSQVRTAVVLADQAMLRDALSQLVDNALLHGATPVHIAIVERGERLAITVTDSGLGIAADDRERVFERFVRLDGSRTLPGIGLGLPIARALVGVMGGRVQVGDAPADGGPSGACFTIELERASVADAVDDGNRQLSQLIPHQPGALDAADSDLADVRRGVA